MLCASLLISAVSVYIFHDVDRDQIGHWNEAFLGLCIESILFSVIIGGPVWLLTFLGRHLFHLKNYSPREMLALVLGIGVTVVQYLVELGARGFVPKLTDSFRALYLVVAIVLCTLVLLRDSFRQRREALSP
jgi:membrane-bound metal-dependent hydrolase YbcI (DUF457 family)